MKVDCQAGVGMMGSRCGGGPLLAASFHAALEESIARHFPGNHCINCMAHSTENIYRCRVLGSVSNNTILTMCMLQSGVNSSGNSNMPLQLALMLTAVPCSSHPGRFADLIKLVVLASCCFISCTQLY